MAQAKTAQNSVVTASPGEETVNSMELKWHERLYAAFRRLFTNQKLFYYRQEASSYELESRTHQASERNYYFRNF